MCDDKTLLRAEAAGRPSNWDDNRRSTYAGRRSRRNSINADDSQLTIENFGGSQVRKNSDSALSETLLNKIEAIRVRLRIVYFINLELSFHYLSLFILFLFLFLAKKKKKKKKKKFFFISFFFFFFFFFHKKKKKKKKKKRARLLSVFRLQHAASLTKAAIPCVYKKVKYNI